MDDTLTIIKNNPSSIINIKDLNDEIVLLALKNGYIPKKEDFIINPKLKDYKILLDKALLTDSSVILFYSRNKLTDEIVTYAMAIIIRATAMSPGRNPVPRCPSVNSVPS